MCTSIVRNGKKTIIGWNLDILDMKYRVCVNESYAQIMIFDQKEGWMPLFGVNVRGDFVAMPTCWPYDAKSEAQEGISENIIKLDIDLLTQKKTFLEIKKIAESQKICSVPGITFQAQLSNFHGDVLQIIPGQGYRFLERPKYSVMTNFSPFKENREVHPWMGWDRYQTAVSMLKKSNEEFDVQDCFEILKATAQTVCPTVVSMVYDAERNKVYWCENRNWGQIKEQTFLGQKNRPSVPGRVYHGFGPVYNTESKILILGSMPSVKSRQEGFYYAHPQNRFWKLLGNLCGEKVPVTIEEKTNICLKHKIALWDVLESCDIRGSSDSSIRNPVPVDIDIVLRHSKIEHILTNGATAQKYYDQFLRDRTGMEAHKLPSTSPANASYTLEQLITAWRDWI